MKKVIIFMILCFTITACAKEKVNDTDHTQNPTQVQKAAFDEETAKQQLAEYLNTQDLDSMKVIRQEISSYVIQTDDTTDEQNDMQLIYEHTYTVSQDGTIYEHTTPEKLIGTWRNQDDTIVYTMTDKTLSIRYIPDNTNSFYTTTDFYIAVNKASLETYNDKEKFYNIIWDTDEFLERNPSSKNMNPQPFIFNYNSATDTFNIGENVFTRDDTKKVQENII